MGQKIANATKADRKGPWTLKSTARMVITKPHYERGKVVMGYDQEAKGFIVLPAISDTVRGVGGRWWV